MKPVGIVLHTENIHQFVLVNMIGLKTPDIVNHVVTNVMDVEILMMNVTIVLVTELTNQLVTVQLDSLKTVFLKPVQNVHANVPLVELT
jgi:hypothetical protein